ncbi:ArsC/Spx/MgsR family protein [Lacinutrix sp. 5H-3-7-4]|uniref:ArsC/Spx/MgsR family protein n=1 Tax=Lacinutrix sp. (strain 5H-3-7-4) TaxID=983544 RepID=UPI00020A3757|nr:ArsC/Spx/MgsR family protein [Lacinutrix sp. 5H-3-7-4]AEH02195.1 arsenate reductase like protein [Lacinutrix sp. 5H-3-7-4]
MIVIYHNPESKNSKSGLEILETSKHDTQKIKYQDRPLDAIKLQKIINILKISPKEIIRTNDLLWKQKFDHLIQNGVEFTDEEYIEIMIEHQELIERPIVINGQKAVIGEPPKKIFQITQ